MRQLRRLKDVIELTGVSRNIIYGLISAGRFANPVQVEASIMTTWISFNIGVSIEGQIEKDRR
jgi:predicted DNA-binding transcriptional regulator AlpA